MSFATAAGGETILMQVEEAIASAKIFFVERPTKTILLDANLLVLLVVGTTLR